MAGCPRAAELCHSKGAEMRLITYFSPEMVICLEKTKYFFFFFFLVFEREFLTLMTFAYSWKVLCTSSSGK